MSRTLRLLLTGVICAVFFAGPGWAAEASPDLSTAPTSVSPAAPSGPSAEIPKTFHDFGKMSEGKDYVYDFVIRNTGTAELQIKKVLPG